MTTGTGMVIDAESASKARTTEYDAVVIGAGVAGLSFALRLPESYRVALLTKGALGESNTRYAQGGISAAIGPDDSPHLHEIDTLAAGAGLCDEDAVRTLVESAPEAVDWLISIGAMFDLNARSGEIELGMEAAHSRHRVLHAGGDATGAEVERAMVAAIRQRSSIDIFEHAFAIDLDVRDSACQGLYCQLPGESTIVHFAAPVVVLAAGGAGQVWAVTSNPPGATADGLAMALRAGVTVADLEFVQFHPTVLAVPGTEAFLVTEAVRGEGAYLRDRDGNRFMTNLHPLAELAPRDVVARGIQSTMAATETTGVFLDLRHLDGAAMIARFPTISKELQKRGLDITSDLIPVAPAAHYFIGGVAAGSNGTTSLPGLLALGEAACSGVHGANRLASNSLLEGLVFGKEAAAHVAATIPAGRVGSGSAYAGSPSGTGSEPAPDIAPLVDQMQELMSQHVAVVRDAEGLRTAREGITPIYEQLTGMVASGKDYWEALNLAQASLAIVGAALFREESRGAHFRRDFPTTDEMLAGRHSLLTRSDSEWRFGRLEEAFHAGLATGATRN